MKPPAFYSGRAWVFGDDINTDAMAPGLYMKGPIEEAAIHCLATINPDFASSVKAGDIVIAGENFGIGSSREQAAQILKILGISTIVARSFGGIFYRNAINFGLLAITYSGAHKIKTGDLLEIDGTTGYLRNMRSKSVLLCEAVPDHLMKMISAGGLVPYLERQRSGRKIG
jgi:3-isopropylmalate/(R)-2-methylmalate dehydratase small subunit